MHKCGRRETHVHCVPLLSQSDGTPIRHDGRAIRGRAAVSRHGHSDTGESQTLIKTAVKLLMVFLGN